MSNLVVFPRYNNLSPNILKHILVNAIHYHYCRPQKPINVLFNLFCYINYSSICLFVTFVVYSYNYYVFVTYILFYYCAGWGYIVAFAEVLQCIKYIIYEFTPSTALLHASYQFLLQFQQVSFLNLNTCVYIIYTIFILLPIPPLPPSSQ
jgi:hypothetical protein